jgi:hypothetical protein
LQNSNLHDLQYGVYGLNSSFFARNNIIGEEPFGTRGNVEQGIILGMSVGNFAQITDQNEIYAQINGVVATNAQHANSVLIEDNTIELFPLVQEVGNRYAIRLNDALMSRNNEEQQIISGNIINLHQSGHGIGLYNVNGTTIANNQINFLSTFSRLHARPGLVLHQSSQNYIYGNTVSGNGSPNNLRGINVVDGDQNTLCCNTVEDTDIGVLFSGYCEETKLRHTTFTSNSRGLVCLNNTRIGLQSSAGNMWGESSHLQAAHYSQNALDVSNSAFFVAPPIGTSIWPEDILVVAGGNIDWFFPGSPDTTSCEIDLGNCERPELNQLATDVEFSIKMFQDNFLYGSYPETSDWEAKRVFYRSQKATKLEDQSNWSTENITFFEQQVQENSVLHKLTKVASSLETALAADPLMTDAAAKMHLLSDQLFSLDQTIEEGEEPSQDYLTARAVLLEQKAEAFADISSLLQQKEGDHLTLVAQLKQSNYEISTPIEAAMAMKEVNDWYFGTMAVGLEDLPLVTETALREMAERCPQRFGSAVGRAQSVLVHYDKSFTPSDECKESDKSGFKAPIDSETKKTASFNEVLTVADVRIYPNPASGVFTIQLPQNEMSARWKIDLLDIGGKLLESKISLGKRVQLNADKYPAGVYWIRVQSSESIISKRVILQ